MSTSDKGSTPGKGPARPDKPKSGGSPARSGAARDGRTRAAGAGGQGGAGKPGGGRGAQSGSGGAGGRSGGRPAGKASGAGSGGGAAAKGKTAGRSAAAELLAEHRRRQKITWGIVAAGVVVVGGVVGGVLATQSPGKPAATTTTTSSTSTTSTTLGPVPTAPLSSLGTLAPAGSAGSAGPEGVPIPSGPQLTGTANKALGNVVDGISCQTNEQTLFHIHAHLTIYVDGRAQQIPYGIGIPNDQTQSTPEGPFVATGACFYWLHTHANDGVVHIESPIVRTYTLGNFFDIWGEPLSADQVGTAKGTVVALYDGKVYTGDPRNIPLTAHAQIQLEIGKPLVTPIQITWPSGL